MFKSHIFFFFLQSKSAISDLSPPAALRDKIALRQQLSLPCGDLTRSCHHFLRAEWRTLLLVSGRFVFAFDWATSLSHLKHHFNHSRPSSPLSSVVLRLLRRSSWCYTSFLHKRRRVIPSCGFPQVAASFREGFLSDVLVWSHEFIAAPELGGWVWPSGGSSGIEELELGEPIFINAYKLKKYFNLGHVSVCACQECVDACRS